MSRAKPSSARRQEKPKREEPAEVGILREIASGLRALGMKREAVQVVTLADMRSAINLREQEISSGKIPVRVAIVGSFNSGKSSFINRLLDEAVCPVNPVPTTSSTTYFRFGTRRRIACSQDGATRQVKPEEYEQLVAHAPDGSGSAGNYKFEYFLPSQLLRHLELVDTPGFENPLNPYDERVTSDEMRRADALFYVTDINFGTITQSGLQILRQIRDTAPEAPVYLIVNKADQKRLRRQRDRVLNKMNEEHGGLFRRVFLFSCSVEVVGAATADDLRSLFEQLAQDKATLAGRCQLYAKQEYGTKLDDSLRTLSGALRREESKLRSSLERSAERKEAAIESFRHMPGTLVEEFRRLTVEAAEACLEADDVDGWKVLSGVVRFDASVCLGRHSSAHVWKFLNKEFSRVLGRCVVSQRRDKPKEVWKKELAEARKSSYKAFVAALRESIDYLVDSEYWNASTAEDAVDDYLEELAEDPDCVARPAFASARNLIRRWVRRLERAFEDGQRPALERQWDVNSLISRMDLLRRSAT